MSERRVGITGGRDFMNGWLLDNALSRLLAEGDVVVHGDARGADRMAALWAKAHGLRVESHPAKWDEYGKAAGAIRNQEMVDSGLDLLIAFPGGYGTEDMTNRCARNGVRVVRADEPEVDQ